MVRQSQWLQAIVSDLQVVVGALAFANLVEGLDVLRRFAERIPSPPNQCAANNLECMFRRLLGHLDRQVPTVHDCPPAIAIFEAAPGATVVDRFLNAIVVLHERSTSVDTPDRLANAVPEKIGGPGATQSWRVAKFHQFMRQAFARSDMRQSDAAAAQGITVSHLSRLLKSETGHSFAWHRDTYRLRHARRLLVETSKTTKEIAALVGYASAEQFCRRFFDRHRVAPSEYRARMIFLRSAPDQCVSEAAST